VRTKTRWFKNDLWLFFRISNYKKRNSKKTSKIKQSIKIINVTPNQNWLDIQNQKKTAKIIDEKGVHFRFKY